VRTFNKKGDRGETSLLFGQRVSKADLRCQAYGTIDEAVAALGIARNLVTGESVKEIILRVQKELFIVAAELATRPEEQTRLAAKFNPVTDNMVDRLEDTINDLESQVSLPRSFVIPGTKLGAAWLDFARAVIRRAERKAVMLREASELGNSTVLRYLNRLADLLFILARYEET